MSTAVPAKYAELGDRIRAARQGRGLSQERFAPLVGITRRHLIRLENGDHRPSPELRQKLADETGEKAEHFSLDEDDEESDPVAVLMHALRRFVREEVRSERAAVSPPMLAWLTGVTFALVGAVT